ncbi:tumor necrosis factor ligand superfamily member 10 [Talpa occidentalis]|uniref:tumor necrosis factor ligand superfamily member 10 n=1 Tax=Talpa occidentalis TaxID=50954 RepID=UPI00188FD663|nr:tumor necrosis factor ligand superfamily member 10 [Talpa occidentalis]
MKLERDPPLDPERNCCLTDCNSQIQMGTMAMMQTPERLIPGQNCVLILIFTVLLQSLCMAVTYLYFTNELKQMQDKYSKSSIACFLNEDEGFWNPIDEDNMNNLCSQVKWQLRQLIRKMLLKTYEETVTTVPEKQQNGSSIVGQKFLQRAAAHITGTSSRSTASAPNSKNGKVLGQKIDSWESSRKGHSFLDRFYIWNGELVIPNTGFYYIYCQTYYRFLESDEILETVSTEMNKKKNKQLVQYIYKYTSYPDPILLMKSARNSCWSKDSEYGLYSIYQGGIFELKEGDRIFVSVTNDNLIAMDQEASFFGAFLIY